MKKIFTLLLALASALQVTAQVSSWAKISSPNYDLTAREDAGMIALNNKLYILGGYNNSGPKDFTEYDPATGNIKKLADIGVGASNPIRGGCLFTLQGKIYSFSPYGTGVAVYNPVTKIG